LKARTAPRFGNINAKNIEMERCTCPVFIRLNNRNRAAVVDSYSASSIESA
jgi:hypothetical protein